ncbi:MAG TPA: hypothetical protein P5551_07315 [Syntrophales bacterium]|nr:hypothetical protein [Syntrophales bacterium]
MRIAGRVRSGQDSRYGVGFTGCLLLVFSLLTVAGGNAAAQTSRVTGNCLACHDGHVYRTEFPASVHGANGCASCHTVKNLSRHMSGTEKPVLVACGSCHGGIAAQFRNNFHYLQENFECQDCHRDIHALKPAKGNFKALVLKQCTECHSNDEYVTSGHGEAVLKGNQDAAACHDCHGLHDTRVWHTSLEYYPAEAREFYTRVCIHCHGNKDLMERNGLSTNTVKYYEETYHGKVKDIGYPTRVAGCADCHTAHNILPKTDPRSTVYAANLVQNCGRCHSGFHPRFVSYMAHPDFTDAKKYPVLFWTWVFMIVLLLSVIIFFMIHTVLWWRKAYWEHYDMEKSGMTRESPVPREERLQQIERFSPVQRVLHVVLIFSFMMLVMTGFPLKYHALPWAKVMVEIWGGAQFTGWLHRAAAGVLIAIVVYVVWMSLRYLFPKGQGKEGFLKRLIGPDSMVPNLKDWEDMKGMFKWFFNRGEMPKFDRWAYWEKFDFWAVFWGMLAIGLTGVLLWKSEWSSYIVPGWVLNVSSLVHSEEALLAALFIFLFHFFAAHFIPSKFPMDRIIFTGTYRVEEMHEQRPLEYERLVAEGRLDSLKRDYPNIYLNIISSTFGYASLLLGGLLLVLILWAVFS